MRSLQSGSKSINNQNRFASLDGLRAVAALGVLWIHCWAMYGAPRYVLLGFDITSVIAIAGNGVDLFFVISGFCMYYFYARNKTFGSSDFWKFLKKRWIRLSPAFYTACVAYIIFRVYNEQSFPVIKSILSSLFYLNGLFWPYTPEGILWSLTPEWQFYVIIPFLLIYQNRIGFKVTFIIISSAILLLAVLSVLLFKTSSDLLTGQIVFRYSEFFWGVLVGRIMLLFPNYNLKHRVFWFVIFIIILYAGRVCISLPVLKLSTQYYDLFKLLGFTLMGAGFSGLMYLTITSKTYLKKVFGNNFMSFLGRISFSFYLWHAMVHRFTGQYLLEIYGDKSGIVIPVINFVFSTIVLLPLATISFLLLEQPFVAKYKKT